METININLVWLWIKGVSDVLGLRGGLDECMEGAETLRSSWMGRRQKYVETNWSTKVTDSYKREIREGVYRVDSQTQIKGVRWREAASTVTLGTTVSFLTAARAPWLLILLISTQPIGVISNWVLILWAHVCFLPVCLQMCAKSEIMISKRRKRCGNSIAAERLFT